MADLTPQQRQNAENLGAALDAFNALPADQQKAAVEDAAFARKMAEIQAAAKDPDSKRVSGT